MSTDTTQQPCDCGIDSTIPEPHPWLCLPWCSSRKGEELISAPSGDAAKPETAALQTAGHAANASAGETSAPVLPPVLPSMFVNVRAATDEDIAIMLRDGKAFTCCREKDGAGCSECSAAFKFDDWFIRRLIARVQEEQLSQMQDRATLAAIRDRLRHILANIHSPGPTAAALRRIADDLDALIGGE